MNEDGNSVAPQSPNFSSPNSPNIQTQPTIEQTEQPQVITSADIRATASTDAGQVAAAAAAMPESDARTAITSAPDQPQPIKSSRFGFNSRRFKQSQQQQPAAPVFAGAPDYFNQAAGDIMIGEQTKKPTGKIILITIIVLVIVASAIIAVMLLRAKTKTGTMANLKPAEASSALYEDAMNVTLLENNYSRSLGGNGDVYELLKDSFCKDIENGEKSYGSLKDKINDYMNANDNDFSKQFKEIYGKMDGVERYSGIAERCTTARDYIKGKNNSDIDKFGEEYSSAVKNVKEIKESAEKVIKAYENSVCSNEDVDVVPLDCQNTIDAVRQSESDIETTSGIIKNKILRAYKYEDGNKVGSTILEILRTMNDEAYNE